MRLSEWREPPRTRTPAARSWRAIVDPVPDLARRARPTCTPGSPGAREPGTRYTILVVTDPGLISLLRPAQRRRRGPRPAREARPLEPASRRASSRIETSGSHRLLSFQIESHVLQGADDVGRTGSPGSPSTCSPAMERPAPAAAASVDASPRLPPPPGSTGLRGPARAARSRLTATSHPTPPRGPAFRARASTPLAARDPLLGQPRGRMDRRPRLPRPRLEGRERLPDRPGDLLLQPHRTGWTRSC